VASLVFASGEDSLCFPGLFRTSGPSHLTQSVLRHGCCCNAIHVVTSLLVFSFQVHLFLVESVMVISNMVLSATCKIFTVFDIREHPPDIPDEWSYFFSLGQSSRPLNLSRNSYRHKFGYELFWEIVSSSSFERFTYSSRSISGRPSS
jgi:hypothetical protein